jgi:hypothetical protein
MEPCEEGLAPRANPSGAVRTCALRVRHSVICTEDCITTTWYGFQVDSSQ